MNLTIKNIDRNNYDEIVSLKVGSNQVNYIETVEESIEEAKKNSNWKPVGIYDNEKVVGFAMYGVCLDEEKDGRVWLDRFLISYENQGKGYGKAGVKLLIDRLGKEYRYDKIYLSVYEDNKDAIALYKKIGFEFNGELDTKGEKVMVLNLLDMK
ncbi:GNAT family N-acetyltransferase [Terrisporobacter sp.]|uniref:GNAT family N-acetyltransferase n=1 Tax=Terrisporobacter sp. TaxID=1965305 RepID=UPI002620456E|nr:GNAT family N-acetyltransferase [Terrisporobacter sp.]